MIKGKCAICDVEITKENVARWDIPETEKHNQIRRDSQNKLWCQECTDHHDSIDWGADD